MNRGRRAVSVAAVLLILGVQTVRAQVLTSPSQSAAGWKDGLLSIRPGRASMAAINSVRRKSSASIGGRDYSHRIWCWWITLNGSPDRAAVRDASLHRGQRTLRCCCGELDLPT